MSMSITRRACEQVDRPYPIRNAALTDVAASISVAQFASRRLPETKTMRMNIGAVDAFNSAEGLLSGGGKISSRHLRRRAASHKCRKRHRPILSKDSTPLPSRFARRKSTHFLFHDHAKWKTARADIVASHHKCNWIPTHIWHTKRFHMAELWGWKVPLIHQNRGPRAATRLISKDEKVLIQDVTWCMQPIWLSVAPPMLKALKRQLLRVIPDFNAPDSHDAAFAASGLLYQLETFPTGLVGPLSWVCTRHHFFKLSTLGNIFIYFFAHPSILQETFRLINAVSTDLDLVSRPMLYLDGGISTIRLRGLRTLDITQKALVKHLNIPILINSEFALLPHESITAIAVMPAPVYLVTKCPHRTDLSSNYFSCGLDLLCDPTMARSLFHALVSSGACPIGVAEEAFLSMECSPPLLTFPRDFPDSKEGAMYWSILRSDWTKLKILWEGGTGRFCKKTSITSHVDWLSLVNWEETAEAVVVVRGSNSEAFRNVFRGPRLVQQQQTAGLVGARRRRRNARGDHALSAIPPCSRKEMFAYTNLCQVMLRTLSLPALLIGYVVVTGKGSLSPGATLHFVEGPPIVLGYMTCGQFSFAIGRYHGFAALGASVLLEGLSRFSGSESLFYRAKGKFMPDANIRVMVHYNTLPPVEAFLSLH